MNTSPENRLLPEHTESGRTERARNAHRNWAVLGALALTGITLTALAIASPDAKKSQPRTVAEVDLDRYIGKWYEIARMPQLYEKGCADVTATYTKNADGTIKVVNTCVKHKKSSKLKRKTAEGIAVPVPGSNNSKLRVSFFKPFYGDYWIFALGSHYEYALVGSPDYKALWVLSRTPSLDSTTYQRLVAYAEQLGFPGEKLMVTEQSGNK